MCFYVADAVPLHEFRGVMRKKLRVNRANFYFVFFNKSPKQIEEIPPRPSRPNCCDWLFPKFNSKYKEKIENSFCSPCY